MGSATGAAELEKIMARNFTAVHFAKKGSKLTRCNRSTGNVPSTSDIAEFKAFDAATRCKHCEAAMKKTAA